MKAHLNVSIDTEILKLAKEKGIPLSSIIEDSILKRINEHEISKTIYPEELAKLEPETYWISPKDGLCHKRGKEQFFISENGMIFPVTKEVYMKRYKFLIKKPKVMKPKPPRKGQAIMNYEESDFHPAPPDVLP